MLCFKLDVEIVGVGCLALPATLFDFQHSHSLI